jgi:hypothetical protein
VSTGPAAANGPTFYQLNDNRLSWWNDKKGGGKKWKKVPPAENFFHQNDEESDLESNRGVCIEDPETIDVCPGTDPPCSVITNQKRQF